MIETNEFERNLKKKYPNKIITKFQYGFTIGKNKKRFERFDNPESEQAKKWNNWGTSLKPAHEPIVLARKLLAEKTVAENVLKCGTGGLNIEESRIEFVNQYDYKESIEKNQHEDFGTKPMKNNNVYGDYSMIKPKNYQPIGRFPANLIHDGSDEVIKEFPESNQNGYRTNPSTNKTTWFGKKDGSHIEKERGFNDSGSSSRFFKICEFIEEDYAPFFYCAKVSKSERNEGCENLNEKPIEIQQPHNSKNLEERYSMTSKNNHPTVKPIKLMEYLIKLITPKNGIVLDPFIGSGTTGLSALRNNRKFIGIELNEKFIEISYKRMSKYLEQRKLE